jgi:dihydrofolate reductase
MISLIAAVSNNGIIGNGSSIPWSCPTDMKYFSKKTTGSSVLMGRKTHESIGRLLPNRTNIIVSSSPPKFDPNGKAIWLKQTMDVIGLDHLKDEELFVIGGESLYGDMIGRADRMYITRILSDVEGDVKFPEVDWSMWKADDADPPIIQNSVDQFGMQFFTYRRW